MKISAWLVLELQQPYSWRDPNIKIARVRQSRPFNDMAVKVTLDVDLDDLQPHVEALVEAGQVVLEIEEQDPVLADVS